MTGPNDREHPHEAVYAAARGSSPASGRPGSERPHRPRRVVMARTFGGSLGWAAAGTIVPGLGLLRTRARPVGIVLLSIALLATAFVIVGALFARTEALSFLVMPGVLTAVWVGVAVFAVLWAGSIAATHLMLRPSNPTWGQRLVGSLAIGLLALGVTAPSFFAARSIRDTAVMVDSVFGSEGATPAGGDDQPFGTVTDPWARKQRLNLLILGGDAGADRTGTRTDTVILASIDTATGNTVLFSLPRQTARMPFPPGSPLAKKFPHGFTAGDPLDQNYALNAIYDAVPRLADPGTFDKAEDPGAEALKQSVGEALGLPVDYYAMVNMEGFVEFVDALGGITVNVNVPIPVGGKNPTHLGGNDGFPPDRWLVPGPYQHLNGQDALWFARGRYQTDDYARMSRQRCVIQAVVQQAQPTKVLANYEALTRAGSNIVATDMPNKQLPAMVMLGLRVKDATMTSVSFQNDKDGFSTTSPDWTLVRERVQSAIKPPTPAPTAAPGTTAPGATATPAPSPTAAVRPGPSTSTPASASPEPSAPASVVDECAYNPQPFPEGNG